MATAEPVDLKLETLEGKSVPWKRYRGKVRLVVNTASACGFTPQLGGLQELHERYGPQGLVVLAFPCNQFGMQERGSAEEIGAFCQRNYGVSFPVMAKTDVNGLHTHPLFAWLKAEAPGLLGSSIKWNFTKFLFGRDDAVIRRYAPQVTPASMAADIEAALAG